MRRCPSLPKFPLFPYREKATAQDQRQTPPRRLRQELPAAATTLASARQANTFPALRTIAGMTNARRSDSGSLARQAIAQGGRTPRQVRRRARFRRRASEQAATQPHAQICPRGSNEKLHIATEAQRRGERLCNHGCTPINKDEGKSQRKRAARTVTREWKVILHLSPSLISVHPCESVVPTFSLRLRDSVADPYAPRRDRIARAASLARSPRSPTGPTQDGQPFSHGHAAINSRVFASKRLWARNSGSEKPIPPGYASYKYKFGSKNSFS